MIWALQLSLKQIEQVYDKHASHYDPALKLYRLIGLNAEAYRVRAVELLQLSPGDCVVDLGCGTGLSFPLLVDKIGPEGRLVGVDVSSEMLAGAAGRVEQSGWSNVELVNQDIAAFEYPYPLSGVIAVGSFGYIAELDSVIERAARALSPNGRMVILDGKLPEGWPSWLINGFIGLFRPFQLNVDYFRGHPWEVVPRHFSETIFEERYAGLMYICAGTAPSAS